MKDAFSDTINSALWQEVAEADDPYSAAVCRAGGYDVYGDLLGKASYIAYLYLLFRGERPAASQARALELLAIALANPGPRDPSVHAAMATGVSGTPAAASLIAALAPGAGSHGGAREVLLAMQAWQQHGRKLANWEAALAAPPEPTRSGVWPHPEHPPGFAPYGASCATPVRQTLALLAATLPDSYCDWLERHRHQLEAAAGRPLAMTGVAACALLDLGFDPAAGEMLTLMLRLPGAAAHALEQQRLGFRQFPFFSLDLGNDPGPATKERA
ncbi:MAG: citryl-CoA lyase [Pseudomonadota bacterium]